MSLETQIQVFITSVFFAMVMLASYGLFNRLCYRGHGKLWRLILEIPFWVSWAYLYFRLLNILCQVQLNIHYLGALSLGMVLYQCFYAKAFNGLYDRLIKRAHHHLERTIFKPIRLRCAIIKKKMKRRTKHGNKKEKSHP